jgi:S-adenosylmethionine hydrolase
MSIITITTDLGYRDPYLAMVKGMYYILNNQMLRIVDLACDVNPHMHITKALLL